MDINEVIDTLLSRKLNTKCNNYVFVDLDKNGKEKILHEVKKSKLSIINYEDLTHEYYRPKSKYLKNVLVDLSEVHVKDILNYALEQVGIFQAISIGDKNALSKFQRTLLSNDAAIQLILYNQSTDDKNDQKILADLFRFNSYLFVISLLADYDKSLINYQTSTGQMLDYREDYDMVFVKWFNINCKILNNMVLFL